MTEEQKSAEAIAHQAIEDSVNALCPFSVTKGRGMSPEVLAMVNAARDLLTAAWNAQPHAPPKEQSDDE